MTRARLLICLIVTAALLTALPAQAQEEGNTAERVRIAWPQYDGTLTPYTFPRERGYPLLTLVYDTLLWQGEPWLARQIRRNEAGTQVTVLLREGASFHDGRPVTAEDVKFSFDYFAERYQERFTPQLEAIDSTEVVDEFTVAFNLEHPAPGFSQPLSDVPILPRHLWEDLPSGETPPGMPVGSGPYRLVESDPEAGYVFRANEDYFLGRPRVGTLELPFNSDFGATVRAFLSRDLDMIPATLPEATQEDVTGPSFETKRDNLYEGTALMFNLREAPFDSKKARQAVSAALDLERITDNAAGIDRLTFPADRGYVHPMSGAATQNKLHRFDPEFARAELAELDLPPITVLAPAKDPFRSEAGRQVVLALERAGVDVELELVPFDELATAVGAAGDKGSPRFEAAIWSISPLPSSSADTLRQVFGSDERQAPLNYMGYSSEEFDRLAELTSKETNPEERFARIREEIELLARDLPVVPLFYPEGAFVVNPSIYEGWQYVEGKGILDKRSFLPRNIRNRDPAPNAAAPAARTGDSGGGIGVGAVIALVLFGTVLAVILVGVVRARRN
jgi:peptide/nickel transport system substrate-binding protein